uniref:Uncharacterized protein n=1 Tax=Amphimedon queenslandica TaxID=400682 RepID=A0A1X7SUZ3_AMPQE
DSKITDKELVALKDSHVFNAYVYKYFISCYSQCFFFFSCCFFINTPRNLSVTASPNQTVSRSRKKRKKITNSTGPHKQPARQSISKEVEPPVKPGTPAREGVTTSPAKTVTQT